MIQCLRVPPGAIAGVHQVAHQLLAQGIVRDERLQLVRGVLRAPNLQQRQRASASQAIAHAVQARRLHRSFLHEVEIGEWLTAPQRQRLVAAVERRSRRQASGVLGQPREALGIDARGRHHQPVARRLAQQHLRRRPRNAVGLEQRT
jgi:hypothetical protein